MSSNTINKIDCLISRVQSLDVNRASISSNTSTTTTALSSSSSSSSSSTSTTTTSTTPNTNTNTTTTTTTTNTSTNDFAWTPYVPPGHTAYSWAGTSGAGYQLPVDLNPSKAVDSKLDSRKEGTQTESIDSYFAPSIEPDMAKFAQFDFRVGKIIAVSTHPQANSLYIEQIDIGEHHLREIVSGLVHFIPESSMLGADVIVFANLKPSKIRGVVSNGMVMCAKNKEETVVEFVTPPQGSVPGERVVPVGFENAFGGILVANSICIRKKNNIWAPLMSHLSTNESRVACFQGVALHTSKGECTTKTLENAVIT